MSLQREPSSLMSLRTGVSHGAIRWTVGLAESEFFMCDNPLPRLTWIPTQRHIDINTHTFLIQICRSGWLSEMLLSASSFGSLLLTPSAVHLAATLVRTHTHRGTHIQARVCTVVPCLLRQVGRTLALILWSSLRSASTPDGAKGGVGGGWLPLQGLVRTSGSP